MGIIGGGMNTAMQRPMLGGLSKPVEKAVAVNKSGGSAAAQRLKKLHYNFKELSALILRSKTSLGAGRAVRAARGRVAQLRGKRGTGIYDSEEVDNAIIHAERMLRIAKKRMKHLRQEEAAERNGVVPPAEYEQNDREDEEFFFGEDETVSGMSKEEIERLMREMQRLMRESMEEMEEAVETDELSDELMVSSEEMTPEDLKLLKKKHRADELREITDADMKYLKAMFNRLQREKQSASSSSRPVSSQNAQSPQGAPNSVALELGGADMPIEASADAAALIEGGAVDVTV